MPDDDPVPVVPVADGRALPLVGHGAVPVVDDSDASLRRAIAVLGSGGLVAVPTETVYGLAADATDPEAVVSVFAAKGRPAGNPLIVHLHDVGQLDDWAIGIPPAAHVLAARFWPGPLTLVLERAGHVSDAVTGGLGTVAVRVPAHPVARRLLRLFGRGLAAPSANLYGRVSPTTADDVVAGLGDAVDLVVDGGRCSVGIESTIVDLTGPTAALLRPGGVTRPQLEAVLEAEVSVVVGGPVRAPGMTATHYAPDTPTEWCEAADLKDRVAGHVAGGARVGVITPGAVPLADGVWCRHADGNTTVYARGLYAWLRAADTADIDVLVVVPPEASGLGAAVRDRLGRAAHR